MLRWIHFKKYIDTSALSAISYHNEKAAVESWLAEGKEPVILQMSKGVTLWRRLSLAGCKPRISHEYDSHWWLNDTRSRAIGGDGIDLVPPWWRHQMETFSALLAICAGNLPVPGEFPAQRPVTRSFDVFFDLRLTKRLSKQSWGWWFETLSCPFWRHRNAKIFLLKHQKG